MSVDEAEIWLKQVVKGGLADKETIKAIEVMLRSYNAILTNYNALEKELDKLQKANETLNSFIEWGTNPFVKEIKEGNNEQV